MYRKSLFSCLFVMATGLSLFGATLALAADDSDRSPSNLRTANWSTDFCQSNVNFDEILVGNPVKDGIPSVNNPNFESIEEAAARLDSRSPVIAVEIEDESRAYPLAILIWHEIANDELAGLPIAVTFCPLCNSSITFERQVNGDVLEFGVSGLLRNSDLIMFDRQSESWRQQLTGFAIAGEYSGWRLKFVTSQLVGFGAFREHYPEGKVLRGPFGAYGRNPYAGYDESASPFLFRGSLDNRLHPTERVPAAELDGAAVAYGFPMLRRVRVVNDTINEMDIVVFGQKGEVSALDKAEIDASRDVGRALMFERQLANGDTLSFSGDESAFVDNETGSRWNIFGESTDGPPAGAKLRQLNAAAHFWFAWEAFHPETELRDGFQGGSSR